MKISFKILLESFSIQLYFENARIPKSSVLGELHGGARVLMKGLNYERLVLAGGPVG